MVVFDKIMLILSMKLLQRVEKKHIFCLVTYKVLVQDGVLV